MPVLNKQFFTMKKLFFASIVMLATLTACQNSESSMSTPEEQQYQKFQSKTTARDGEELPPLSPEEEKAKIEEAIEIIKADREAELKGTARPAKLTQILCHTNYSSAHGHACVWSNGYLVSVDWHPMTYNGSGGMVGIYPDDISDYSANVTNHCSC